MNGMNNLFMSDPVTFLQSVCVDNASMQREQAGANTLTLLNMAKVGTFDFVVTGGNSVRLTFAGAGYMVQNDTPIQAYWCPFLQGNGLPGWVDVPRHNPRYKFVFTAAMQGCAFAITNSPASAQSFRVFHNQHPEHDGTWRAMQDSGANAQVSTFSYDDYGNAQNADGGLTNAFNFMWRPPGGAWSYVSQSNRFVPLPMGFSIERDPAMPILDVPAGV